MPRKHKQVYLSDLPFEPMAKGPNLCWTTRAPAPGDRDELWTAVCTTVDSLSQLERDVINRRYGRDGGGEETLEAIGQLIGRTRERVRQIEKMALENLRRHLKQT